MLGRRRDLINFLCVNVTLIAFIELITRSFVDLIVAVVQLAHIDI